MAYVYHKYTATTTDSLYVTHKCTNCGKVQTFLHVMSASVTYDDRTLTQRGFQQRQIAAQDALNDSMAETVGFALMDADDGDYTTMNINHRCVQCGHREPWATPKSKLLTAAFVLSIILGVISTFRLVNNGMTPLNIALCAAGWGLAVIFGLWMLIRPILLCAKTENLPKEARPIFTGTKEKAAKAEQYFEQLGAKS